jgi:hypothetical protein
VCDAECLLVDAVMHCFVPSTCSVLGSKMSEFMCSSGELDYRRVKTNFVGQHYTLMVTRAGQHQYLTSETQRDEREM